MRRNQSLLALLFVAFPLSLLYWCCFSIHGVHSSDAAAAAAGIKRIVVVGSVNADTFLPVQRLPIEGENLTTLREPELDLPGGKGCTQAVAAAKLLQIQEQQQHPSPVLFIGQFGNDAAAVILQSTLSDVGVDLSFSEHHSDLESGRGYVFLAENSGQVSAVVSGGANARGWHKWETMWDAYVAANRDSSILCNSDELDAIFPNLESTGAVMLQREVPEKVNLLVAAYCKAKGHKDLMVVLDIGGEDRPITSELLSLCDYVMPNESELLRLVNSLSSNPLSSAAPASSLPLEDDRVVELAKILQNHGARNVLVTRGRRGSTLICEEMEHPTTNPSVAVLHQPACHTLPGGLPAVDETGAGDCFRAGFVVALLLNDAAGENDNHHDVHYLTSCLQFASAAGACSVTKRGAVPSTPTRKEVLDCLLKQRQQQDSPSTDAPSDKEFVNELRGGGSPGLDDATLQQSDDDFPFLIGSRLNSMKDRPELWNFPLVTPNDFVRRQAQIKGLSCVDFNYPQHFSNYWSNDEAKQALRQAGLVAGAVCLRYPSKFARGAMNHPDVKLRREAIDLTKEAATVAIELGCNEVVVWSAFDGYDYPFQVNYDAKWQELVDAFQECCDSFPNIKFSLEFKPTDENTRFFTAPSTGAALLLVNAVDRENFGLTLDVGHMLMSGENPGQSIAMVGRAGKLFGIQLNDGFTRLAAEDGLMFGSVHPSMALEIMFQLRRTKFAGHVYFDTFPQRSDPVREAEYNIRRVKAFWKAAGAVDDAKVQSIMEHHDAIGALELVDEALRHL